MTTIHLDRTTYGCPDWCARLDHEADIVDAQNPPAHYSPGFGAVSIQAFGDGPFMVELIEETIDGVDGLFQHARDVIAAAEWMVANR